jgi:hypothetical protein
MLREEGMAEQGGTPTGKFWGVIGGLSGRGDGVYCGEFSGDDCGGGGGE